jgi:hypothetical protein
LIWYKNKKIKIFWCRLLLKKMKKWEKVKWIVRSCSAVFFAKHYLKHTQHSESHQKPTRIANYWCQRHPHLLSGRPQAPNLLPNLHWLFVHFTLFYWKRFISSVGKLNFLNRSWSEVNNFERRLWYLQISTKGCYNLHR